MQLVVSNRKVPEQVKTYVKAQLTRALELTFYDIAGTMPLSAAALGPSSLSTIPAASREGLVVNFERLRFSYTCLMKPGGAATLRFRVLIFDWLPISVPVVGDILEATSAGTIIQSPIAFRNRQFFRVVSDEVTCLNPGGVTSVHKSHVMKYNRKVRFNDDAIPAKATGLRYWMVCTDLPAVADPSFAYHSRMEFTDA